MCIAQVELVGTGLLERKEDLLSAMEKERQREGYLFFALMVTDIVEQGTKLLCVGDCSGVERAFDTGQKNGIMDLPGVMSRKKQVAPRLIGAF
jgi:manganese-dependent inorganic pyrophosphatase